MKTNLTELVSNRYELLNKGFLNQTDVRKFVPCGYRKAKQIFDNIRDSNKANGIENLYGDVILVGNLISYLGLTEKKIKSAYYEQKKGGHRSEPHTKILTHIY